MGQQQAFDPHFSHWADIAARRVLAANPERRPIVVAAGITPSGVVHVGNFREVMTVDLVARALRDQGIRSLCNRQGLGNKLPRKNNRQ
jgi:lysyl-tRNA synthetase class I